jgi:hypothetical protein
VHFIEIEDSLHGASQAHVTGPCSEPDESASYRHLLKMSHYFPPLYADISSVLSFLRFVVTPPVTLK